MTPRAADRAETRIPLGRVSLGATLAVPPGACGVVAFAHGSGSGRRSPRNRFVADALNERGLATLLMDLLTEDEERAEARTRHLRFDIALLAGRLAHAVDWLASHPRLGGLGVGLFGASTGAAAALVAASRRPDRVRAVVSRGGRPDLAGEALDAVFCPALLIVGERDEGVVGLNQDAAARLAGPRRIVLVPRATHLFEEPGALEAVARLAGDWFQRSLT